MLPRQIRIDHLGPLTIPLHGLHAMALRYGEEQFAQKGSCLATWLIAIKYDVLWLESEMGDGHARQVVYALISDFLKLSGAHAYSYLSEAYVSVHRIDENPDDDDFVLPSDRPASERDEVLWITSFDTKGGGLNSRYLITPSRHASKLARLGPRADEDADDLSHLGMAWNLFKQKGLVT